MILLISPINISVKISLMRYGCLPIQINLI